MIKPNPEDEKALLPEQWDHLRIRAVGGEVTSWLNGKQMVNDAKIGQGKGFIALQIQQFLRLKP